MIHLWSLAPPSHVLARDLLYLGRIAHSERERTVMARGGTLGAAFRQKEKEET